MKYILTCFSLFLTRFMIDILREFMIIIFEKIKYILIYGYFIIVFFLTRFMIDFLRDFMIELIYRFFHRIHFPCDCMFFLRMNEFLSKK